MTSVLNPSGPHTLTEKSLSKGLGEDYGQLPRGEIDDYPGNPG